MGNEWEVGIVMGGICSALEASHEPCHGLGGRSLLFMTEGLGNKRRAVRASASVEVGALRS